ncbi:MAG: hypothetical protein ACP5QA_03870 [Phycisphaerae bacterium]
MSWYRTGDPMPLRAIQNVLFSEQQGIHGPHTIKRAKFLSFVELRPYLRPPKGTIEIGDGHSGNFLVPTEVKSITVQTKPMFRDRPICAIGDNFPHFQMSWVPLAKWSDPRNSFKEIISGVWPVKSLTKPLCRILTSCGVSSSKATKLIDETIRQHLAKQTDLQLLRNTLSAYGYSTSDITLLAKNIVRRELASATDLQLFKEILASNGNGLRKQTELGKAIWLTLLATLKPLICSSNGTVAWIHLRNGRLLCFAGGNTGYGVWQFGESGEMLANGLVWFTDIGKWPQTRRVRALMSEFIPFFSQSPPASLARRSETGR